jgi:CRISPR-associated protein Csm1
MKNTESDDEYIQSIFCKINNKPKENNIYYPDNRTLFFRKSSLKSLDTICYPQFGDSDKFQPYPEQNKIDKARKTCKNYPHTNRDKPYLLVSGDYSGIQDTVYTISSKGALKSLRARSFMLEFLCEHICYELIHECFDSYEGFRYKDYRNHVIFSGGGTFCLLLPNNDNIKEIIQDYKEIINDWAFEEFSAGLYIAVACTELNANELEKEHFRDKWLILSKELEKDKKQKFKWKPEEIFHDDFVKEPKQKTNQQECQICRRDDVVVKDAFFYTLDQFERIETQGNLEGMSENHVVAHSLCYHLFILGDKLTECDYIYRSTQAPVQNENGYLCFPGIRGRSIYYVIDKAGKKSNLSAECIWKINGDEENDQGYISFLYANYVRKISDLPLGAQEIEKETYRKEHNKELEHPDRTTASFAGLAHAARGADLIGCLRMDVDNLGKIISEDIANEEFDLVSLSHLSHMLNLFFKVYLCKICEGDLGNDKPTDLTDKDYTQENDSGAKGRNVSVIYAGGDDLFIIGAWDEITELSYDIHKCFAKFSGLGISGGVTLHKEKFPLYQMARLSGEAEGYAKDDKSHHKNDEPKNRIALLYDTNKKARKDTLQTNLDKLNIDYEIKDRYRLAVKWKELEDFVIPLSESLKALATIKNNKLVMDTLPSSFIERLFTVIEEWQLHGHIFIPTMARVLNEALQDQPTQEIRNLLSFCRELFKSENIKKLHIPLIWISYLRR